MVKLKKDHPIETNTEVNELSSSLERQAVENLEVETLTNVIEHSPSIDEDNQTFTTHSSDIFISFSSNKEEKVWLPKLINPVNKERANSTSIQN